MKKILVVFGTRPEAIKMCPVVLELKSRHESFDVKVCVTGQHRTMLDQVLQIFNVTPDYDLHIMKPKQTLADITNSVVRGIEDLLSNEHPDIVLVHGDTTTSFAAALASFYSHVPVAHVEAGLRTYNLQSPWPEEFNRQAVDIIADYMFAPTPLSRKNLLNEGKKLSSIYVTGNTGIDALRTTVRADFQDENIEWASDSRLLLLTAHRRENLGAPMHNIFRAVRRVVECHENIKVIYPIHMNPLVREIAAQELKGEDRIRIIEPLDVIGFHNLMSLSHIILTDSGGIQEEAPSLGKPVLVLRDTTERPEGVNAGTLKITGTDEDVIFSETSKLLIDSASYVAMSQAQNPYGDGYASQRIADVLQYGKCNEYE